MMDIYSHLTRRVTVRYGFSEEEVWRRGVDDSVPLLAFAVTGPIDAPEAFASGSMESSRFGPVMGWAFRY